MIQHERHFNCSYDVQLSTAKPRRLLLHELLPAIRSAGNCPCPFSAHVVSHWHFTGPIWRWKFHTNLDISPGEIPSWGPTSLEFSRKSSYKPCQFGDFPVWGHQRGNSSPLKSHSNPIRPPCLMVETTGSRHFGWSNVIRSCYSKCQIVDGSACPSISLFTPWSPFLMFKSPCALVPYHIFLRKKTSALLLRSFLYIFIQLIQSPSFGEKNGFSSPMFWWKSPSPGAFLWRFPMSWDPWSELVAWIGSGRWHPWNQHPTPGKNIPGTAAWWAKKNRRWWGKCWFLVVDWWYWYVLMVDWWLIDSWLVVDWCFFAQMTQDAIVSARTFQIFQKNKTVFSRNIENWFSPPLGHHQSSAGLHQHHSYTFGGKNGGKRTYIDIFISYIYR